METTELRDGSVVVTALLGRVLRVLKILAETQPDLLRVVVAVARDPAHACDEAVCAAVQHHGLLDRQGHMSSSIRAIVVSSAEGDDADLVMVSPVMRAR